MIKLLVPYNGPNIVYIVAFNNKSERPVHINKNDNRDRYCLGNKYHEIMEKNNIEYSLCRENGRYYIIFQNKDDAMLFKLSVESWE